MIDTPLTQDVSVAIIRFNTQLAHDHIVVSQSVLAIVIGLHEVAMGVQSTWKLYQSCTYFQTFLKRKGSRVLLTLCTLLWCDKAFKNVSEVFFFFFLICKVVC